MHENAVTHQVRETVADTFGMSLDDVSPFETQTSCGRWTSVYHMMLLVALEERFGIRFSMDQMTSMTSIERIVDVLQAEMVPTAS